MSTKAQMPRRALALTMRIAAATLVGLLALAGCLSDDAGDTANGDEPDDLSAQATPPKDIVFTGSLKGVGDVSANAPIQCPLGAQQCTTHVVTVPAGSWDVTFTLVGTDGTVTSQGVPYGTDYDLFVDGVGESVNAAGEPDIVTGSDLPAGDYDAQILAWHDLDGAYTLTVSFTA